MQKAVNISRLRSVFVRSSALSKQWSPLSSFNLPVAIQSCSSAPLSYSSVKLSTKNSTRRRFKNGVSNDTKLWLQLIEYPPRNLIAEEKDTFNAALAEGKIELRFLIPAKMVDSLAAEGDQFINSLNDKSGASLELLNWERPEGVLKLVCRKEDARACVKEILPKILNVASGFDTHFRLLLHSSHDLAISGVAGKKRKELLREMKLHLGELSSLQHLCPMSNDYVFRIKGSEDVMLDLMDRIVSKISGLPIKGLQLPFNEESHVPSLVDKYGGYHNDGSKALVKENLLHPTSEIVKYTTIPKFLLAKLNEDPEHSISNIMHLSTCKIKDKQCPEHLPFTVLQFDGIPAQVETALFLVKQGLENLYDGRAYLRAEFEEPEED